MISSTMQELYFSGQEYAAASYGRSGAIKIGLVKRFFTVSKKLIFRYDYKDSTYRKGMDVLTWFLGYPRKKVKISPLRIGHMPAEWTEPSNREFDHVILYIHGGAYNHGSLRSHRTIVTRLALECRCRVLAFEYRLAPEFPFPTAITDTVDVYTYLQEQGIPADKIILAGDSAGGGLSLSTALQLKAKGLPMPMAVICFSPWTDLECTHPDVSLIEKRDPLLDIKAVKIWGRKYADGSLRDPLASPVYGSYEDFCPVLIQAGTDEVLYYDSTRVAALLAEKGVPCRFESYEHMIHVFQMFAGFLPQADQSLKNVSTFIHEVLNIPVPKTANTNSTQTV